MKLELYTIQNKIEQHFGFKINVKSRRRNFVDARRLYFRLAREFTQQSLFIIGKTMDRDHATALFAVRTCKDICKVDRNFNAKYLTLKKELEILEKETHKKNLFSVPKFIHPGRFRYDKIKSISKIFNKRGHSAKQCYELH